MQHGAGTFHDNQDSHGKEEPDVECDDEDDDAQRTSRAESVRQRHGPEDNGELLMCKGQGPETEVGSGVRDAVETEFCDLLETVIKQLGTGEHTNSVDNLMDHNLTEFKLLMFLIISETLSDHSHALAIAVQASPSV